MPRRVIYLLETHPYDPVTETTVNVYFSDSLIDDAELGTSDSYPPRLKEALSHETAVFDQNIPGGTNISIGAVVINNQDGEYDYLIDYSWDSRSLVLKRGYAGDAYASYDTVFVGSTTEIVINGTDLTLAVRDNSYKLAIPLQGNKYDGTGGAGGGLDLKGRTKPLCFGLCRNITPVTIDPVLMIFQVHDGPVSEISLAYDQGNRLTKGDNYADYASLAAAVVDPGTFATCHAEGFFRLGAETEGQLTADVRGEFWADPEGLGTDYTNIIFRSQEFDHTYWVKALGAAVTADTAVAPDATTTADTLSTPSGGFIYTAATIVSGDTYTASVYVKRAPTGSADAIRLTSNDAVAWNTGGSTKITLTNDWQRVTLTGSITGSSWRFILGCKDVAGANDADCVGDVLIWQAQLVAGASPGPVILTTTTSATVNVPDDLAIGVMARQVVDDRVTVSWNETSYDEFLVDAPWSYEGVFLSEPNVQIDEFLETIMSSVNSFWHMDAEGKIVLKVFKFETPSHVIRAEDLVGLTRNASPSPLHRVKVNYSKNSTVQNIGDFVIPRQTLNGFLDEEVVYVDTNTDGTGGVYDYVGEFNAFLNDTKVNDLSTVLFVEDPAVSWLTLASDGTFTISDPGIDEAEAVLKASIGEYVVAETFKLVKSKIDPPKNLTLTTDLRRFYFSDAGVPTPSVQVATITAVGTNVDTPLVWSAYDNLGTEVELAGTGDSRTLDVNEIVSSLLVFWVRVQVESPDGTVQHLKIIVQRGEDAFSAGILGALAATTQSIDIFYEDEPPVDPEVDDMWFDTNDGNKLYRWNGSAWVEITDARLAQALTDAATAQATADGKITTFFGETTPTATAIGDLWFRPSTGVLYRWDGTTWSNDIATRNFNRGAWAAGVQYYVGDFFTYNGSSYSVITAHTSTALEPPPNANVTLLAAGGSNAVSGVLTNESHTVPAENDGTVLSYTGASGDFRIYSGATDVSANFSLSTETGGNPQSLTVNYSSQTYTVTAGFDPGETVATLIIRATGSGAYSGVIVNKTFTLAKSLGGVNAKLLAILSDRHVITYDSGGTPNPGTQTTTFTAQKQNTTATVTWSVHDMAGTAKTPTTTYLSAATGDSVTMTEAQFASARGSTEGVRITATLTDGATITDRVSLIRIQAAQAGANAKLIVVGADSNIFSYDGAGNLDPSPQTVVVTAQTQNLLNAIAWTWSDNLGTASATLAALITNTSATIRTVPSSVFTGTPTRLWLKATATGTVSETGLSDSTTIYRVVDGSNALTVIFSNEAHTVPTAPDGSSGDFSGANGTIKVFYGSSDVTATTTFSEWNETNCTGDVNTATNSPVAGQPKGYYRVTAMTADTAKYTIRSSYNPGNGAIVVDRDFTLARSKAGIPTVTGYLTNESHTVQADSAGTVSSFTGAGGTFKVWNGTTDVTTSAAFSVQSETGVDVSIVSNTGVYTVNSMSADQGTAVFRATYNSINIDRTYSIAKSKAGANAKLIYVSTNIQTITYGISGQPEPTTQQIDYTITQQNTTGNLTVDLFRIDGTQINANTYVSSTGGSPSASGNSRIYTSLPTTLFITAANFQSARGSTEGIILRVTRDGVSDQISVVRISDAEDLSATALVDTMTYASQDDFLSKWTSYFGAGEITSATDTTVIGGRSVNVGNNSGDDLRWVIGNDTLPYDPEVLYQITFIVKRLQNVSSYAWLGVGGKAADRTTLVDVSGSTTSGGHYAALAQTLPVFNFWHSYIGYVRGKASSGTGSASPDPLNPGVMQTNVAYLSPLMILNATIGAGSTSGQTSVAYVRIKRCDTTPTWRVVGDGLVLLDNNAKQYGNNWTASIYSAVVNNPAAASAVVPTNTTTAVIGVTSESSPVAASSMTWGIYFQGAGSCALYTNGSYSNNGITGYAAGDRFEVVLDGNTVKFLKNGVEFHSVANVTTSGFRGKANFASGHSLRELNFTGAGAAGEDGTPGVDAFVVTPAVPAISIATDNVGTPKSGALPKTVQFTARLGSTDVTASATWPAAAVTNCAVTNNGGGSYTITSVSADSGQFTVTPTYSSRSATSGVTYSKTPEGAPFQRVFDDTLTDVTSGTFTIVSDTLTINFPPSSVMTFSMSQNYSISGAPAEGQQGRKQARFMYRNLTDSGSWTQAGTDITGSYAVASYFVYPTEPNHTSGSIGGSYNGLTAPSATKVYELRLEMLHQGTALDESGGIFQVTIS